MKKKLVVFSGAGISKESGIATFRDSSSGLWNNYRIEDVATPEGWEKRPSMVMDFYNERRKQLAEVEPNEAHKALVRLEEKFKVTTVTQNVDDLHDRAGSSKIIHLHGELTKVRSQKYVNIPFWLDKAIDVGYKEVKMGDLCPETGEQLRPHIVWFGEYPFQVNKAYDAVSEADILLVVGTSLQIGYTLDMLNNVKRVPSQCEIYYIDPQPTRYLDNYGLKVNYINKKAVEGVTEIVDELLKR